MRKKILMFLSVTLILSLASCNSKTEETKPELSEWQKNVMLSENLPLDEEQLTKSQKTRLNSIFEMENYLCEKYDEEFVYVEYLPAELPESEKLIVYPQMTGDGNGENIVTVKRDQNGKLTDDYYDYSIPKYAEKLIDEFLTSYFGEGNYLYKADTMARSIKKTEIIDGDFQWKCGASDIIFIKGEKYDTDVVEKFAVDYAKFLYEHRIDGTHRINIISEFNTNILTDETITEMYECEDYAGFYYFSFDSSKTKVFYDYLINDGEITDNGECDINEYFKKH
ncbi:MAG: hypothetical protein ACI4KB_08660 [Oscillospiraceae bacterium]